jgi:pimeloyl-ACP methyl ester carboxylesterase
MEKRALVLLHGFGEDARVWALITPALQNNFRVLAPDLPGSGAWQTDAATLTMESMADAIHDWLKKESVEQCTMIGHSMGGYVALAFAEKYPQQLNGLGLFHSTAYADSEEKIAVRQKGIEFMETHGGAAFLKTTTPNLFGAAFKTTEPEAVDAFINDMQYFSATTLIAYYRAMMARPNRSAVLQTLHCPVLFIIGDEDKAVPPADSLQQSILPAVSMICLLRATAHMGMMEDAPAVIGAVLEFMELVEGRG